MFPEALLLHYLDDLDSKMEAMRGQFERAAESDGAWTAYNPSLGRPLLNTAKFLAEKTSQVAEEEEQQNLAADPEGMVAGNDVDSESEVTPLLTGLETGEKEKGNSTMTSTAREDKI
jgi:hypothetical protein